MNHPRLRASPWPGVLLSVALLALGALAERRLHPGGHHPAHPSPWHARAAHTAHPWAATAGVCAGTGQLCVDDRGCGGARCGDPGGIASRLRALAGDAPTASLYPALAWNGDGYGIAWIGVHDEQLDVWFARLSAAGQRLGAPVRLTRTEAVKALPAIAWTGREYAVTWTDVGSDDIGVWMARVGADGKALGVPARVSTGDGIDLASTLVWNGQEYALAWYHLALRSQMSVRFARIRPAGERVGADRTLHQGFMAGGALGLAWTGDAYGLAWNTFAPRDDRSATVFLRVGAGGEPGGVVRVGAGAGRNGSAAATWSGRNFGLVWEDDVRIDDDRDPLSALAFAAASPTAVVVPRKALTDRRALAVQPSLAWSGEQYGLAWTDSRHGGLGVLFARLSDAGVPAGAPVRMTGSAPGVLPSLVWTGREWGLAWTDARDGGLDIYFNRLTAAGARAGADVRVTAP